MFKYSKARDIRSIIARPLLILISLSSLMIFLLINAVLIYSLDNGVFNSLNTAATAFQQLHKYNTTSSLERNTQLFLRSYSEVEHDKYTMHLIVTDNENNVLSFSEQLSKETSEKIIDNVNSNKTNANSETVLNSELEQVKKFHLKFGDRYFIVNFTIGTSNQQVFLVAETDVFRNILSSTNRGLILILLFLTVFLLLITFAVATYVGEPIRKLSDHAKKIGDGILTPVEINSSCIEIQNLEKSINEMVKHLQAYKNAQATSLQNLSHQLRTPLMSIQGYAEGIALGYFDDKSEATSIIIDESKRLSAIVDQVLILSRLDTFNQPVDILPMSLNGFIKTQIKGLTGYAYKQGIAINYVEPSEEILILADGNLLYATFVNILSNGIRHAAEEITIDLSSDSNNGTFSISDDGCGLSEEDLQQLFNRFYKGNEGNFGLGLSISKSATEYMGGEIIAENLLTHGAKFTVSLPLA